MRFREQGQEVKNTRCRAEHCTPDCGCRSAVDLVALCAKIGIEAGELALGGGGDWQGQREWLGQEEGVGGRGDLESQGLGCEVGLQLQDPLHGKTAAGKEGARPDHLPRHSWRALRQRWAGLHSKEDLLCRV